MDGKGFLYIADTGNQRIRRVGLDGIIETIAGNGDAGFSGDGGLATEASFDYPHDVAVDSKGNVYIADSENQRIRVVDPDGIITTFAGNGNYGFSGDGGLATEAELSNPSCVAVDRSGNVYIGDNTRVRKVVAFSGVITTIAGSDERDFDGDGGPATEAKLTWLSDIAIDGTDVYIADYDNDRIRLVDLTGIITTFAGGRGDWSQIRTGVRATEAALLRPEGVAADSRGNVYIADTRNHRIRVVNTSRIIDTLAGSRAGGFSGDGGPADQALLNFPTGVAVDSDGINVYFVDTNNNRVRRVGPDGILALMVTSLTFDTTGIGGSSEQTLKVSNIGTGALTITEFTFDGRARRDYQGQKTLPTIDPGGIETLTVIFTPSREGVRSATMFVESDVGTKGIDVTGFGVEGGPEISLSASSLALETARIGENAVQGTITITNPGGSDLSITAITLEGVDVSEFDVSPTSATIAPGESETVTITFDPASIGNKSTIVHVDHNSGDQLIVDLTAVAEGGPILGLPADVVSFGSVEAETSDQGSFTINNPGTEDLSITGIIVEGTHASDYEVSPTAATIESGASETITVIFSPTSSGTKSAGLLIDHNAGDPTVIRLSGVVYAVGTSPDFDGTGKVDLEDFFLFAAAFSQEPTGDNARFDLDGNNKIDFDDFFLFAGAFGKTL